MFHEQQSQPRNGTRAALVLFLVVSAMAACSAPNASPSPSAQADIDFQPNPWQELLAGAGPDGQVSLELALETFVIAIGPLPGVPAPQPPFPTADEIGPGEVAIQWVEQHRTELTPEQEAAFDAYLVPGPDAIVVEPLPADAQPSSANQSLLLGGVGFVAVDDETPMQRYQEILRDAEIVIINRLGRVRTRNYTITVNEEQINPGLPEGVNALAYAYSSFGSCSIHLNPVLVSKPRPSAEIGATLAHELFHCFQFELGEPAGRATWVVEGEAEFAGEDAAGPSLVGGNWWAQYLHTPHTPLFDRTYDAFGFYLHMQERGVDVWKQLDKMYEARGGAASYHHGADPGGPGFLYSWGSGFFKDPALGGEWNAQGPWALRKVPNPEVLTVPIGDPVPFDTVPYTNRIALVTTDADVVNVKMNGFARIRLDSGQSLDGLSDVNFCAKLGGDCACPAGSDYSGPALTGLAFPAFIAITGATDGVTGALTGLRLDDFCNPQPTPAGSGQSSPPGTGSQPPCPRGCAGSNGEPHLRTVDNVAYDLQSAGEYVLLRSVDQSLEIQARQEPIGAIGETDISVNTALAVRVNGHRVAVYVSEDRLVVRVDGAVTEIAEPLDLGNGARVVRYETGVQVDLPDGSRVYALGMRSSCCLNIVVAPSDQLRTDGAGLLGNVAAGTMPVPALPDGTRLPRVETAHDRFVALYETLAPAWLVTDETTLFDYADGKTTASYQVADFPTEAQIRTVEDLTPDERAAAATTCATVTDPDLLLECMFDVTVSDLMHWATLYGITEDFIATGTDALDLPAPDPDALPDGFEELMPSVVAIHGAAVGPGGSAYLSVQETVDRHAVLKVDLGTGAVLDRIDTAGGGKVALAGDSVWVGGLEGISTCSVTSLDPSTLEIRGSVTTPCDFLGTSFTSFDGAIWFLDRTTSDADARGGRLRRIDPATREITSDVVVPYVNGLLTSTPEALFWLAQGQPTSNPDDASVFRLLPNDTALTSFGVLGANSQPLLGGQFFPVGEGFWAWPQVDAPPVYRSSPDDPGEPLAIEGTLVGADESALYANQISTFDSVPELWRYPRDGTASSRVVVGVTLQTANGNQALSYFDNAPLLFGEGFALKLWIVPSRVEQSVDALVMQATPLP